MMIVSKKVSFDAAHYLPNYEGKCKNMHGHHWVVELAVEGEVNTEDGMVIDFAELSKFLKDKVVKVFDHKVINNVISNPTAENIALYIEDMWEHYSLEPLELAWIKVWETEDSMAMWEKERMAFS